MNADLIAELSTADGASLIGFVAKNAALNTSGLLPCEYKILIEPLDVDDTDPVLRAARAAGLEIAKKTSDREAMAQVKGRLIASGGNAFEDWAEPKPQVGDEIYYAKYSGLLIDGADGKKYRFANDKDVVGIIQRKEGAA